MENRLIVQNINENESSMELTPEELTELEAIKGGNTILNLYQYQIPTIKFFPYGILDPEILRIPQISQPFTGI